MNIFCVFIDAFGDHRERALAAIDAAEWTEEEIAQRFRVFSRLFLKMVALRASTGSIDPRPRSGGRKLVIQGEVADARKDVIRNAPDATLQELREATGFGGCPDDRLARALRRLNVTQRRRYKSVRAHMQFDSEIIGQRQEWNEWMGEVDSDRFVFLDESYAKTTMTRRYGRAPRGERVVDHVPMGQYHLTTILGALRQDGTIAAMVYEGGTNVSVMQAVAEGQQQTILRRKDAAMVYEGGTNVSVMQAVAEG
jgi:hypothetical protein